MSALSGVQQEVARATRPAAADAEVRLSRTRNFGVGLALLVAVLVVATAPLWVDAVFPAHGWQLVPPLAVATSSYVLVASVSGSLYGVSRWREIAALVVVDGVLRLAVLAVAALLTSDVVVLAWAAALPFPVTILVLWPVIRGALVGRTTTDVGYRGLAWNVARTVTASISLGAIVGGLPLLLAVTSPGEDAARLGVVVLAVTLVRAPLVVGVLALQSYLLVRFRDTPAAVAGTVVRIGGVLLGAGVALGVLGYIAGPPLFVLLFGPGFAVDAVLVAVLVGSSVLIGAMCVVAAAVLARDRHLAYSLVFLVAAVVTVATLLVPGDLTSRVTLATLAGPAAGLLAGIVVLGVVLRGRALR